MCILDVGFLGVTHLKDLSPCHGSKYNMIGEYFAGPAPRNLDRFNVSNVNGRFIIDTGTIIESPRAPGMSVKYPQGLSCIALTTEE